MRRRIVFEIVSEEKVIRWLEEYRQKHDGELPQASSGAIDGTAFTWARIYEVMRTKGLGWRGPAFPRWLDEHLYSQVMAAHKRTESSPAAPEISALPRGLSLQQRLEWAKAAAEKRWGVFLLWKYVARWCSVSNLQDAVAGATETLKPQVAQRLGVFLQVDWFWLARGILRSTFRLPLPRLELPRERLLWAKLDKERRTGRLYTWTEVSAGADDRSMPAHLTNRRRITTISALNYGRFFDLPAEWFEHGVVLQRRRGLARR